MPRKSREIPWLENRPNGYWYACWYDKTARRTHAVTMGTKDAGQAQTRFADFLLHGSEIREPTRLAGLTVAQVLDDYLREHVSEKVIDKERQHDAAAHLKAFFGTEPIQSIDIPASRRYRAARRAGEIGGGKRRHAKAGSDATIRRELVVLNAAAKHALKWRRIEPKDLPSIDLPADTRREAPWLLWDDIARAIEQAPTLRLRRFVKILYYTAARRGSIESLTKFQIDLRAGRINLRAPDESTLKRQSKKRRPIVPIHPEIRPDIEQLLNESPNEFLFGDARDMYRPFVEHLESLGFDATNPHILRHSRATHLLQSGVSIYDVAKLLGDTVATVERVYGHHCPEYLGATIEEKAG